MPALDANMRFVIASKAQAVAACGPRVLAMVYSYGSIDSPTSTHNISAPSPTPSPSPSAQPMSSSSNGLRLVGKEKAHLVSAGFAAMLDSPRKGIKDSLRTSRAGPCRL